MFELFKSKPDTGLLCPKCERPLLEHDEGACKRKMSRRFFLGATSGIVVAAAIPAFVTNSKSTSIAFSAQSPVSWFPGAKYMLSVRDGYYSTSVIENLQPSFNEFSYLRRDMNKEINDLRRLGFNVIVAHDELTVRAEYRRQVREQARILNEDRFQARIDRNGIDTIGSFFS